MFIHNDKSWGALQTRMPRNGLNRGHCNIKVIMSKKPHMIACSRVGHPFWAKLIVSQCFHQNKNGQENKKKFNNFHRLLEVKGLFETRKNLLRLIKPQWHRFIAC